MREIVWPEAARRLSERTIRDLQKKRAIPFCKIGRCVYFEPEKVKLALLKRYEMPAVMS